VLFAFYLTRVVWLLNCTWKHLHVAHCLCTCTLQRGLAELAFPEWVHINILPCSWHVANHWTANLIGGLHCVDCLHK
jgi:hypothetical protein